MFLKYVGDVLQSSGSNIHAGTPPAKGKVPMVHRTVGWPGTKMEANELPISGRMPSDPIRIVEFQIFPALRSPSPQLRPLVVHYCPAGRGKSE